MKFNHLNVPDHWKHYWSRYPEGYTILEALISWVSQVDSMVDNVNSWNEYLDDFVSTFDKELQQTVTDTLSDWQESGFINVVISEALQWQLDDYIATNEADKLSIKQQLATNSRGYNLGELFNLEENTNIKPLLQEFVNTLTGNVVLRFPSGLYYCEGLTFPAIDNLTLVGNGTTLVTRENTKSIFKLVGGENIHVKGFVGVAEWVTRSGHHTGQFVQAENINYLNVYENHLTRANINTINCNNVSVTHNSYKDPLETRPSYYAIYIQNAINSIVDNNIISDVSGDGVKITIPLGDSAKVSENTLVTNNIISNCADNGVDTFAGGKKVIIDSNIITNTSISIVVKNVGGTEADFSSANGYSNNIVISNNYLSKATHSGVAIASSNVLLHGNFIDDSNIGVSFWGINADVSFYNTRIHDNIMTNLYRALFTDVVKVRNFSVRNCHIENVEYHAIDISGENVSISDTTIKNISRYGLLIKAINLDITNTKLIDCELRGASIENSGGLRESRLHIRGLDVYNTNVSKPPLEYGLTINKSPHEKSMIMGCTIDNATTDILISSYSEYITGLNSWTDPV